jgi:hypothetical protein
VSVIELPQLATQTRSTSHALRRVGESLCLRLDELCDQQVQIARGLSAYDVVSDDELTTSARRNVGRLIAVIDGAGTSTSLDPDLDERGAGRRRALQGLDGEDVALCYRMSMAVLRDEFIDEALAHDVPADEVLRVTRQLWALCDWYASELASARTQAANRAERRHGHRSQSFLSSVQRGEVGPAELAVAAAAFGLSGRESVWVIRARPSAAFVAGLRREIERCAVGGPVSPLLGTIGSDLVGVAVRPPSIAGNEGPVVVLGPLLIADLYVVFAESAHLLDVAVRFRLTGIVDRERVGVHLAVADHVPVARTLRAKYVTRVQHEAGTNADVLLQTIEAYLHLDRGIKTTAESLHIHVNTLRHRIHRYEEIVGESLCDTRAVVEIWWALVQRSSETDERAAIADSQQDSPSPGCVERADCPLTRSSANGSRAAPRRRML